MNHTLLVALFPVLCEMNVPHDPSAAVFCMRGCSVLFILEFSFWFKYVVCSRSLTSFAMSLSHLSLYLLTPLFVPLCNLKTGQRRVKCRCSGFSLSLSLSLFSLSIASLSIPLSLTLSLCVCLSLSLSLFSLCFSIPAIHRLETPRRT